MNTPDARAALLRKLKALLAKTQENGCTESEALSALAKAEALMQEYGVSHDALDADDQLVEATVCPTRASHQQLLAAVGAFCNCTLFFNSAQGETHFVGLAGDIAFAEWLLDTLSRYSERNAELYMLLEAPARLRKPKLAAMRLSFILGCNTRLAERMKELVAARTPRRTTTGRDVAVVRNSLIERKLHEMGIRLHAHSSRVSDGGAYYAGQKFGNRATFDRPVASASGPRLIGGR